ncbi:MAG: hypothetical protein EB127_02705 [Alphaproteobacteria bacterium]|nr:hypothetical protein [Alphaproteobacteria bacterium]
MGLLRKALNSLFGKQEVISESNYETLLPLSSNANAPDNKFEMSPGRRLSPEEQVEENKYTISTLDPKLMLVINMIDELYPNESALQTIAEEPTLMRSWLAHIVYKENIDIFYTLINGSNINLVDPVILVPKSKRPPPKPRKVKCLKDLPLQRSLLN